MEINISNEEWLRVTTNEGKVYADVSSTPNEESLTIQFYPSFSKQIIIEKNKIAKMFIFPKEQGITDFDYGLWNGGKIVWESF